MPMDEYLTLVMVVYEIPRANAKTKEFLLQEMIKVVGRREEQNHFPVCFTVRHGNYSDSDPFELEFALVPSKLGVKLTCLQT